MKSDFNERLNKILDRITSNDFLHGKGLGAEIPFYAFDYPPEREPEVREHIAFLIAQIPKRRPGLRFAHVNLFDLIIGHLKERGFYDKAITCSVRRAMRPFARPWPRPWMRASWPTCLPRRSTPRRRIWCWSPGSAAPIRCCAPKIC